MTQNYKKKAPLLVWLKFSHKLSNIFNQGCKIPKVWKIPMGFTAIALEFSQPMFVCIKSGHERLKKHVFPESRLKHLHANLAEVPP